MISRHAETNSDQNPAAQTQNANKPQPIQQKVPKSATTSIPRQTTTIRSAQKSRAGGGRNQVAPVEPNRELTAHTLGAEHINSALFTKENHENSAKLVHGTKSGATPRNSRKLKKQLAEPNSNPSKSAQKIPRLGSSPEDRQFPDSTNGVSERTTSRPLLATPKYAQIVSRRPSKQESEKPQRQLFTPGVQHTPQHSMRNQSKPTIQ